MVRFVLELVFYLLAARYVAYSLALSTYMAPTLGKRDTFRGETQRARTLVTGVLGLVWPVTIVYILVASKVITDVSMPDSRSASRALKRTLKQRQARNI